MVASDLLSPVEVSTSLMPFALLLIAIIAINATNAIIAIIVIIAIIPIISITYGMSHGSQCPICHHRNHL